MKPLRATKYCEIWKRGILQEDDDMHAIEKIKVKSTGNFEVQFAFYKKREENQLQFVSRPLDLSEEILLELFEVAKDQKILSDKFFDDLKGIIDRV
ncbi:hypothetical protein [Cohnella sp. GCM10012308]|uniref:hypothetical protein n=1 Tax=Cohnella sp. GCM10012308 TaxID=3317329 RepID=UPI00360F1811